jgi:hypothetical protein
MKAGGFGTMFSADHGVLWFRTTGLAARGHGGLNQEGGEN